MGSNHQSSSVGMTQAATWLSGVLIFDCLCSFAAGSNCRPSQRAPSQTHARMAGEFSPTPAVNTKLHKKVNVDMKARFRYLESNLQYFIIPSFHYPLGLKHAPPDYRPYLREYLESSKMGYIRHNLHKAFELHRNLLEHGAMLPNLE